MLTALNIAQTILYVALLALAGQGILYVLAGANRESNVFYSLLRVVAKPFTASVRKLTPKLVGDSQVPIVTFCLLVVVYAVVTFERADLCITAQLVGQPGCR
jgi:hypothetical protein